MAFIVSNAHQQPSFSPDSSDLQKQQTHSKDGGEQLESASITSQLHLISSSSSKAAALDRDLVLRRIRHHKDMRKFKSAFQALMGSSELQATSATNGMASWLDQEDSFSSP